VAKDLTLTIRKNGTDYSYGSDRLLVEVGTIDQRVEDLVITLQDIPLTVGPDDQGNPELVGVTDPTNLPEETLRAKLEDAAGNLLMNGAVVTSDATYLQNQKSWSLRLIDQAGEEFFSGLEGHFFDTSGAAVQEASIDVTTEHGRESVLPVSFFQPRSVLEQVFSEIGATWSMPAKLWDYEIEYSGGAIITHDSTEVFISCGDVDDRTLVEEITKLAGWRIQATYQGWPASDFDIQMQPTTWPAPGAVNTLGGDEDPDGYEVTMERSDKNWALELRDAIGRSSPDLRNANPGKGGFGGYAVPPPWGAFAPEEWTAAPPGIGLETFNIATNVEVGTRKVFAERVQTKFKVPEIYPKECDDDGTEVEVHGIPHIGFKSLGEDISLLNTGTELFVIERGKNNPSTPVGGNYALFCRHPSDGEWGASRYFASCSAWAMIPYEEQPIRRATVREAVGKWIGATGVDVGDPQKPLGLLGKQWLPVESKENIDKEKAELVLHTPIGLTQYPARPTRPSTDSEWTVIVPRGGYKTVDRGSGDEDWIILHWERTPTREAEESYYHAQYRDNDGSGDWIDFTQCGGAKIYSTAATLLFKSAGNGGQTSINIDARVRPVKKPGSVGGWRQFEVKIV